jgi:hypothetical protein
MIHTCSQAVHGAGGSAAWLDEKDKPQGDARGTVRGAAVKIGKLEHDAVQVHQ